MVLTDTTSTTSYTRLQPTNLPNDNNQTYVPAAEPREKNTTVYQTCTNIELRTREEPPGSSLVETAIRETEAIVSVTVGDPYTQLINQQEFNPALVHEVQGEETQNNNNPSSSLLTHEHQCVHSQSVVNLMFGEVSPVGAILRSSQLIANNVGIPVQPGDLGQAVPDRSRASYNRRAMYPRGIT